MPELDTRDQKAIADVVQRLMASAGSPANLSAEECRKLSEALLKFAETFPFVADRVPRFVNFTALAMAARDVKTGTTGTWSQATQKRETEVARRLSTAQLAATGS